MKTFLITGGAGFVGSNLAILLKKHHAHINVRVLDNLKREGSWLNLERLKPFDIQFIHGDVRQEADLLQVKNVDCIIDCSAEPSVLAGYDGSTDYVIQTNLMGTINCLKLAKQCHADFIFLSTSRVYPITTLNQIKYSETADRFEIDPNQKLNGVSQNGINEKFLLTGARSLYGASKLASELMITEYIDLYNIRAVINRCGVIAGPWQLGKTDQGVVSLWVAKHFFQKPLTYIGFGGDGKQVRDILSIDDLYDLIDIQLSRLDAVNGDIFNVGGGQAGSASLKQLTHLCQEFTGNRIEIGKETKTRPGDVPIYITDNKKVSSTLAWSPQKNVALIIEEIAKWIHTNHNQLEPILGK